MTITVYKLELKEIGENVTARRSET